MWKVYCFSLINQSSCLNCLQCFDTIGWASGRAAGL